MHSAWHGTVTSSWPCVPSGRAILNWVRFGKYEHGLRASGPALFALIELGSFLQKYAALFHYSGSPIRASKVMGRSSASGTRITFVSVQRHYVTQLLRVIVI